MRCALVITTHERAEPLARVLQSLSQQHRWPDEVIIAEDGGCASTAALVDDFVTKAPCPVQHIRQAHKGFRAGAIRNKAIAHSGADYLILLDGDMVMHPQFVADHLAVAREGYYTQGARIQLDERATRRLMAPGSSLPGVLDSGLGLLRRTYALRAPRLSARLKRISNALISIKACNQGFWRRDLIAVNGFDEAMIGWGSEDKELCARLENSGRRRQTLIFGAIAFHLAHPPASRSAADENRARWQATLRSGRNRCEQGIDGHLP